MISRCHACVSTYQETGKRQQEAAKHSPALRQLPPLVYHLLEAPNWPFIQQEGLLCASALLANSGLGTKEVERLERHQRQCSAVLPDGRVLRDQTPMPAAALARCLVGASPAEWYALLNRQVFFWFDVDRLNRVRRAVAHAPQLVLVVDARALVAAHGERAALTPFNVGNARRKASRRGRFTLVPYRLWQRTGWDSENAGLGGGRRPRGHRPVELVVDMAVPDIMQYVLETRHLAPGEYME